MKQEFGATAERAYMLAGVMTALTAVLREHHPRNRDGGELQTYQDAMHAAITASDALDDRIDSDAIEGCFCYEVHNDAGEIQKLYREIARLAATDQVTGAGTIDAVAAFLAERHDLRTSQQDAGHISGQAGSTQVSLDGGETYQSARLGVRVIHPVLIDDNEQGELHVNHTTEGLIADLWVGDTHRGTRAELSVDLAEALHGGSEPEHEASPSERFYELQLAGFDGTTDETDDRIVWISANLGLEDLSQALRGANLLGRADSGVVQVLELLSRHTPDFCFPRDLAALEQRVNNVARTPAHQEASAAVIG